jgi:hypothetical protein
VHLVGFHCENIMKNSWPSKSVPLTVLLTFYYDVVGWFKFKVMNETLIYDYGNVAQRFLNNL